MVSWNLMKELWFQCTFARSCGSVVCAFALCQFRWETISIAAPTPSRYASQVLCQLPPCCVPTLCFFISSFTPLLPPLWAPPHSLMVIHLKLMSTCMLTATGWKHLNECSAPPLPYITLLIGGVWWCQDCYEFSYPQDMSYTLAVHLNIGKAVEGGRRGGEGGRGGEQDTSVKRRTLAKGRDSTLPLWIHGDHRWHRAFGWWAGGNHGSGTQLYLFSSSQKFCKSQTSKTVFSGSVVESRRTQRIQGECKYHIIITTGVSFVLFGACTIVYT